MMSPTNNKRKKDSKQTAVLAALDAPPKKQNRQNAGIQWFPMPVDSRGLKNDCHTERLRCSLSEETKDA
jgi:hypothetical protein